MDTKEDKKIRSEEEIEELKMQLIEK